MSNSPQFEHLFERVRHIRRISGLSQEKFAKSIGTSRSNYSQFEIGKSNLMPDQIINVSSQYEVRLDWILKGEGELEKGSGAPIDPLNHPMAHYREIANLELMKKINEKLDNNESAGLEWAKKLIEQQEREINRLWSIIEKAGLGKNKVSPLLTAIANHRKNFVPGSQFRVHQLSN